MQIFELLTRLASSGGLGVMVFHDLALLSAYVGKALIPKKGGQLFYGPAAEALVRGQYRGRLRYQRPGVGRPPDRGR